MSLESYDPDYYERLGLDPSCDVQQIRRHHRLLARLYHPDVSPSAEAHQSFVALQEAYEVLADGKQRSRYDEWLTQEVTARQPLRMNHQFYPTTLAREAKRQRLYTLVDVGIKEEGGTERTPLNLMLVLDRSSSMKGRRLHYVKEAARRIVSQLDRQDSFGIVAFNDRGQVVLPTGRATDRGVALSAIDSIRAAGGTELASGLRMGLQETLRFKSPHLINHLILLTDGRTYGDEANSLELAELAAQEDVGMTMMGLGTDWNDDLLDEMAKRSGGSAHFIAEPDQAVDLFQTQVQRLQQLLAHNVRLIAQPGAGITLLQAHEVTPGLRHLSVEGEEVRLGTLSTGAPLRLLVEFCVDLPSREVALLAMITLSAQLVKDGRVYQSQRMIVADIGEKASDPTNDIYQSAQRVAMLHLQERTWEALQQGESGNVVARLEKLADRFLEIGAMDLAVATQREVEVLQQTGSLSEEGRKIIKYGTRMLALPAPHGSK